MEVLYRVLVMAQQLGALLGRIMSSKKEQILWGAHGAAIRSYSCSFACG